MLVLVGWCYGRSWGKIRGTSAVNITNLVHHPAQLIPVIAEPHDSLRWTPTLIILQNDSWWSTPMCVARAKTWTTISSSSLSTQLCPWDQPWGRYHGTPWRTTWQATHVVRHHDSGSHGSCLWSSGAGTGSETLHPQVGYPSDFRVRSEWMVDLIWFILWLSSIWRSYH